MASRSSGVRNDRLSCTTSCIGPNAVELLAAPFLRNAMSWDLSQRLVLASFGGDVGGVPLIDPCPLEPLARDRCAHEIARRVTITAMTKRLDQIGAAIPLGALGRIRLEPLRAEEQRPPHQHAVPDAEGKRQLIFAVLLPDGWKAAEIRPQ